MWTQRLGLYEVERYYFLLCYVATGAIGNNGTGIMREMVKKFWGAEFGSAKTGCQSKARRREEGAISLFIVKTRNSANAMEPPLSSQSELYIQAVAARSEGEPF
jgi:hypothetical protein